MLGAETFDTEFRKGEYFVLDHTERENVSTVIFPLPTAAGKGILVAPTADGNVIYGPTSRPTERTTPPWTRRGWTRSAAACRSPTRVPHSTSAYASIAGCAPRGRRFHRPPSEQVEGLIITAGICSPGLTSAPAIAEYVEELWRRG